MAMSEHDDFPNYGNASSSPATAPEPAASWNPALRPDSIEQEQVKESVPESDEDFFERYPGATPRKQQPADSGLPAHVEELHGDDGDVEAAGDSDHEAEEEAADAQAENETVEAHLGPESTAQAEDLTNHNAHGEEEHLLEDDVHRPEEHYEHQGAVPDMEAAVVEGPDAPLLEDEEEPPTTAHIGQEPAVADLDGEVSPRQPPRKAHAAPPQIDRSFTTNFTEMPTQDLQRQQEPQPDVQQEPESNVWPSSTDDKTFGELLDNQEQPHAQPAGQDWPAGDDNTFGDLLGAPDHSQQEHPQTRPTTQDWPDGDDSFDGLLGAQQPTSPQHAVEAEAIAQGLGDVGAPDGATQVAPAEEEDLAAKWQAALDDDALLDDDDELLEDEPEEESKDLDPSKLFGDDDDDLLDDEPFLSESAPQPHPQPLQQTQQPQLRSTVSQYLPTNPQLSPPQLRSTASQYLPRTTQQNQPMQSPYAAQQPFLSQTHGRSAGTPDTGLFDILNSQPTAPGHQPPAQRPGLQQAQSFADKAKGGYQSPYDLPMDVVKPRRRPAQQPTPPAAQPNPPPRTSSFGAPPPPPTPPMSGPPRAPSVSSMSPPQSSHSGGSTAPPGSGLNGTGSTRATPKADSGFFADLPVAPKSRARPSGAYTPQPSATHTVPGIPQAHPSRAPAPPAQPVQIPAAQPQQPGYGGLRQPDRLPLLPDQPTAPGHAAATRSPPGLQAGPPPAPNRFSPAPPSAAPAASRYSPAPTAHAGQPPKRQPSAGPGAGVAGAVHPFAPRTSSPLAYAVDKPQPPLPTGAYGASPMSPPTAAARTHPASPPRATAPPTANAAAAITSPERKPSRYSPADPTSAPASVYGGPVPPRQSTPPTSAAPPRPKTQSPGATMKQPKFSMSQIERPTSAAGVPHVPRSTAHHQQPATRAPGPALPHRRQFSREANFAPPQDERSQDPLQRWKGHPIFSWNAAGGIVSTFPKHTPYWGGGPGVSSIKVTPGSISLQDAGSFMPLHDRNAKFPGPLTLKSKGKKKEVITWLNGKVEDLERANEGAKLDFSLSPELKKRSEEKLVLWKIARILVEHDGTLEGNPKIEEEVRNVLLPNLGEMGRVAELQSPTAASAVASDPVDRQTLIQLRQALLEGQRERAVWLAEEKKLWGHAMLIASTMGPETWKQIIQSFVRNQVKIVGSDARSLAALYQVFAGNSEDCVDELVPPSARAGFQMVSKTDGSVSSNPLEGLDQWRETLGLITGNRTPNDGASLVSLGKLLTGYGRVEAAHTCFLFARAFAKHSGADDAEANFVLLGDNHQSPDESFGNDLDSIILTEIYEWASSLSAASTAAQYIPHLQSYKLVHAYQLSAYGLKTKAQTYCDHITQAYTSTTRPSQYYHPAFTQAVSDLHAFLAQAPHDGKGSFLSKPALKTVSSGASKWFSKFVSGEDDQSQDATGGGPLGSAGDDSGPFGRVSGELSRNASGTELYNPMMTGGGMPTMTSAPVAAPTSTPSIYGASPPSSAGRYAPGSTYTAPAPHAKPAPEAAGTMGRYAPQLQQGTSATNFSSGLSPADTYSPTDITNNLGVPSLSQQRPVSAAPRAASSRYAPSSRPTGQGLGVQGLDVPRPEAGRAASDYGVPYQTDSRRGSAQEIGSQGSYEPTPSHSNYVPTPSQSSYEPTSSYQPSPSLAQEPSPYAYQSSPLVQAHQPTEEVPKVDEEDAFGSRPNDFSSEDGAVDEEGGSGGGFQPISSYEPPSYQPYEPEPDPEEADESKPKKKSFMDDDDDSAEMEKRAAALKKAQADREADEAFRKAAEADVARDSSKNDGKKGSGWLTGWFGKKDPTAELNKPIKAKLGEESSFYFDKDLGKWVNKKGGPEAATPAAATPPPPRGPPSAASRAVSAAGGMGPPSGPPSRTASAAGRPPTAPPIMPNGPGSGPPSRAGTPASMRSASAVVEGVNGDGALAPPSRPATSMSNASSLDDLLGGPPGARKAGAAGTVKGKKRGGRYVDVMAK
jgi:COPII coat assembly protein SEC16